MANQEKNDITVIVVMGVSGAGKTTVGKLLAEKCDWQFADADDFHSAANKAKMHSGVPLDDDDRRPWLATLSAKISQWVQEDKKTVLACSALKESYRAILCADKKEVAIVYLKADYDSIAARLKHRSSHFMNNDLLKSQFATLEEPRLGDTTHNTTVVDAEKAPDLIVDKIISALCL